MRSLMSSTYIRICPQFQITLQTAVNKVTKVWRLAASEENAHFMALLGNETMYVQRNHEARSRNHCYSGKGICIIYYESVSVFLP